jgi:hypothetical protein
VSVTGERRRPKREGKFSALYSAEEYGLPLAAPLPTVAELLGRPLPEVEAAAARVEPYRHLDGSPRWSVKLVNCALTGEPISKDGRRRQRRQQQRAGGT